MLIPHTMLSRYHQITADTKGIYHRVDRLLESDIVAMDIHTQHQISPTFGNVDDFLHVLPLNAFP